jgi:hypothetical protein
MSQPANQTGEGAQGAVNGTSEIACNTTEGMGAAMNETGEALSNVTGGIMEWNGCKISLTVQAEIRIKL